MKNYLVEATFSPEFMESRKLINERKMNRAIEYYYLSGRSKVIEIEMMNVETGYHRMIVKATPGWIMGQFSIDEEALFIYEIK